MLSWPLVVWLLYSRLGPGRALIWSVLGAYLFLPELLRIDLPVLPDLDKHTLPALSAAVISYLRLRQRLPVFTGGRVTTLLILCFVISPLMTVLSNRDVIAFANGTFLPALRIYDSLAVIAMQGLLILPLFLARRDLARPEAIRDLLGALLAGGLLYLVPILIEARLSPQLHSWIYGYFQHDFIQAMRFGGFRPFVFMPHGLWVAFFMLSALLACAALIRDSAGRERLRNILLFPVMAGLLILCKSFGPVFYAICAVPLLLMARLRGLLMISAVLALIVVLYPMLRGAQLVPVNSVLDFAASLNAERAQSFGFRVMNEEALLDRAAVRPWFGWGGYGRGFVHDMATGENISIADGAWIIHIGSFGWLGFLAQFGLLCMPVWLLLREGMARGGVVSRAAASLALIHALNLADLLPNATLTPVTWLTAGALLGYAEAQRRARIAGGTAPEATGDRAGASPGQGAGPARPRRLVIEG